MRVLLLNPPGARRYLRDYYCSTVSKAGYYWQPIDLLIQSGFLHPVAHLEVLDATAEGLTSREALARLERSRPDVVLALVGAQSQDEDVAFLHRARRRGRWRLALTGEVVLGDARESLRAQLPSAFVLRSFASGALARWVSAGAPEPASVREAAVWEVGSGEPTDTSRPRPRPRDGLHLPSPRHELFSAQHYRVPFDGGRTVASLLTAYGCPHRCTYCNSGMGGVGYAERPLDDVFEEVETLTQLGTVGHLFIRDMDFTAHRGRTLRICARLAHHAPGFTFSCYARPDELDDELCAALANAGCRLVQLGLESFDESTLSALGRPMSNRRIQDGFRAARRHSIRCGAHVILGLPHEGWATQIRTLRRLLQLNPDYVSFNLLQRRERAALAANASGPAPPLSQAALECFRRWATFRFYLRPRYLLQQLLLLENAAEARSLLYDGLGLLAHTLRPESRHD